MGIVRVTKICADPVQTVGESDPRASGITPHVTQNNTNRRSAIDGRTTRHPGYAVSMRIRERIEETFGWMKTCGGFAKTHHKSTDRVDWMFTLTAAACNLIRLPTLLTPA